eukprot:1157224-Pelagomonas_calceolata.AAC.15
MPLHTGSSEANHSVTQRSCCTWHGAAQVKRCLPGYTARTQIASCDLGHSPRRIYRSWDHADYTTRTQITQHFKTRADNCIAFQNQRHPLHKVLGGHTHNTANECNACVLTWRTYCVRFREEAAIQRSRTLLALSRST